MKKTNAQRQKKYRDKKAEIFRIMRKYVSFDGHWTKEAIRDWNYLQKNLSREEMDLIFERWKKEKK